MHANDAENKMRAEFKKKNAEKEKRKPLPEERCTAKKKAGIFPALARSMSAEGETE